MRALGIVTVLKLCPFETYGCQEPVRPWEMASALKLYPFETYGCQEPVRAWGWSLRSSFTP